MVVALLIVLGVNLVVIIVFAALVIGRRRWLKRQPGEFAGAIRLVGAEIDGSTQKWRRGSGRWLRGVLVWNKSPFIYLVCGSTHPTGIPG